MKSNFYISFYMGVEKGKFLRTTAIVPLNPDGSVPFDSEELLRRTFRFRGEEKPPPERSSSETPFYKVVLYYLADDIQFGLPWQIDDIPDALDVLEYAIKNSPFAESNFVPVKAEIQRTSVREAMFGNASNEDIMELYGRIDGPEPIYNDLAILAKKARGQGRVMDD